MTWDQIKGKLLWLVVIGGLLAIFLLGRSCGVDSQQAQIENLSAQIAQSEKTIELKDGLYATQSVQMSNLTGLLGSSDAQVAALKKQLADSQSQLLSTQQISLQWKQAYQSALNAKQSDGGKSSDPPTVPGSPPIERERVDFAGDLGPIHASGYTLTDPATAFLTLNQTRPLLLDVSVAKGPTGAWTTYVTSSDPNMDVRVNLAGVDPGVVSPGWRQRIYLDAAAFPLGGLGGSIGLSYHFDHWSLGAACQSVGGVNSCGATLGIQLFR